MADETALPHQIGNLPPAPDVPTSEHPALTDTGPWYYAQLNDVGRCVGVCQATAALPKAEQLVRLNSYDESRLGKSFVDGEWVSPAPSVDPAEWLIDVGPFFDRFGAAKMALLMSTNTTVRALVADLQVRKWVDLKRPAVSAGIDALIQLGVPGVNAALKTAILATPVTAEENLALRVQFFGGAR